MNPSGKLTLPLPKPNISEISDIVYNIDQSLKIYTI